MRRIEYKLLFFNFSTTLLCLVVSGCYIPSTTDWRETPKVVLQVCVPSNSSHIAEIVYYRPKNIGVWTAPSVATTIANQDIFEGSYEDPTPLNTAFAVHLPSGGLESKFFIYLMRDTPTSNWSEWRAPDDARSQFPSEVNKFVHVKGLSPDEKKMAPKIRVRTEYLNSFDQSSRSRERFANIPSCG